MRKGLVNVNISGHPVGTIAGWATQTEIGNNERNGEYLDADISIIDLKAFKLFLDTAQKYLNENLLPAQEKIPEFHRDAAMQYAARCEVDVMRMKNDSVRAMIEKAFLAGIEYQAAKVDPAREMKILDWLRDLEVRLRKVESTPPEYAFPADDGIKT